MGALIVLIYCDRQWFKPRLIRYTKSAATETTRLLARGEYVTALDLINGVAWVRFFGQQPFVLEWMGQQALAKRELDEAITYFKRALIDLPSDRAIDAHFGILQGQLLGGDIDAAIAKASMMRTLSNDDTFVELRLEMMFEQHSLEG